LTLRTSGTILLGDFQKEGVLTVQRKLCIILCLAVLSLFLLASGPAFAGGGAGNGAGQGDLYSDVPRDHWAYEDIKYLVDRGILTPLPGERYNGDQPLDRYSAAALIARTIRYLQNNPESVTPEDLDVLKDMIFKVSADVDALKTGGVGTALETRLAANEQAIAELQSQGVSGKLATRINANFIISLTALLVGIIGVALATLGL
jgi:hypothetical protein